MILGYEQPVDIPVMSIYDKDMLKVYINALLKDYDDSRKEWNTFIDKYGDFISPIKGASDAYYAAGVGGAMDKINNWQQQTGIDPLRSREGRAMILRAIAQADKPLMNAIRQSAENKKLYDKAVAEARLKGDYDPEYEAYMLKQQGIDPDNWDHNLIWDKLAPDLYQDPSKYWGDKFKSLTPTDIMYDKDGKETTDPSKAVTHAMGVSKDRVTPFVNVNYQDYSNTPSHGFLQDKIANKKQAEATAAGTPISREEALKKADDEIKASVIDMGTYSSTPKADEWAMFNREAALKREISRSSGRGGGGGRYIDPEYDIFEEARNVFGSDQETVDYMTGDSYAHKINPVGSSVKLMADGSGGAYYEMSYYDFKKHGHNASDINQNTLHKHPLIESGGKQISETSKIYFIPRGRVIARYRNKQWHYYIYGQAQGANGNMLGGGKLYAHEVTKRGSRYKQNLGRGKQ